MRNSVIMGVKFECCPNFVVRNFNCVFDGCFCIEDGLFVSAGSLYYLPPVLMIHGRLGSLMGEEWLWDEVKVLVGLTEQGSVHPTPSYEINLREATKCVLMISLMEHNVMMMASLGFLFLATEGVYWRKICNCQ